jgi:hypothetical protein
VKEGADPESLKPVDLAIPMFGYTNPIGIDARAHHNRDDKPRL